MKIQFYASRPVSERPLTSSAAATRSAACSKVPLHAFINQLFAGLQPLAMKRGSILLNGIPADLTISAEENMLAYVLWNLIKGAVNNTKSECVHIIALVKDDRTMICVKDVGAYYYHAISREYRKIQDAAEKLGGSISLDHEGIHGASISFSIANPPLAA